MRRLRQLVFVFSMSLCSAVSLLAQGTDLGTIRGLVQDLSGAAIPGAKVDVTDLTTNKARQTQTNDKGEYD
ncbi:MAG: carboxypeptidase regulatory-like domain-containing protein, partial [Acidobacteriaceae bacterium]|nr:carboxypeptidase regulatory-like domain-containing protein [Acidobacteriaceae bacterium]